MGLRRTSARCQILFLTFWLDWSQRLHWEVDILLVPGYVRSGLALIMVPSGDPRHIALLWILRVRCKSAVTGGSLRTILGLSVVSWATT
jgi:hypothetical protein